MRRLFVLLPITLLAFACEEIEFNDGEEVAIANICGVDRPLENLPWLKEVVDNDDPESLYCQPYTIIEGTYQNQSVFMIQVSGALCCTCAGSAVYDCEGELVFVCEPEEENKIRDQKVIWSRGG